MYPHWMIFVAKTQLSVFLEDSFWKYSNSGNIDTSHI